MKVKELIELLEKENLNDGEAKILVIHEDEDKEYTIVTTYCFLHKETREQKIYIMCADNLDALNNFKDRMRAEMISDAKEKLR